MTSKSDASGGLWSRQQPRRTSPKRSLGGFYRTPERDGPALGGVPLSSTEDAVVAAVRMAYKVAEKQVARSTRIAHRLREAGDRAVGPDSERKAVDTMEDLAINALLGGLSWWEGSVAEGRCPVKRLIAAEFQLLANLLGSAERHAHQASATSSSEKEAHRPAATDRTTIASPALEIAHKGARRAVRESAWKITGAGSIDPNVALYSANAPESEPLTGELALDGRTVARLTLNLLPTTPAGPWSAAICSTDGVQLGIVEIVL